MVTDAGSLVGPRQVRRDVYGDLGNRGPGGDRRAVRGRVAIAITSFPLEARLSFKFKETDVQRSAVEASQMLQLPKHLGLAHVQLAELALLAGPMHL